MTGLDLRVDAAAVTPPFEQIRAGVAARIASGALPVGTKLPPVRRLADDLGVAVNTVARAYRELEAAGLVETRGRNGTTVTASGDATRERLLAAARAYASVAHETGVDTDQALRVVQVALGG